jgi:hypothetical protein
VVEYGDDSEAGLQTVKNARPTTSGSEGGEGKVLLVIHWCQRVLGDLREHSSSVVEFSGVFVTMSGGERFRAHMHSMKSHHSTKLRSPGVKADVVNDACDVLDECSALFI